MNNQGFSGKDFLIIIVIIGIIVGTAMLIMKQVQDFNEKSQELQNPASVGMIVNHLVD